MLYGLVLGAQKCAGGSHARSILKARRWARAGGAGRAAISGVAGYAAACCRACCFLAEAGPE